MLPSPSETALLWLQIVVYSPAPEDALGCPEGTPIARPQPTVISVLTETAPHLGTRKAGAKKTRWMKINYKNTVLLISV